MDEFVAGWPPKVLVVEDEPEIRELVCELLGEAGYELECCSSADEAVKALAGGFVPDVLITDIRMPGLLDGFDLARHVRSGHPHVGVVYMSGFTDGRTLADEVRAAAFLPKPFKARELQMAVRNQLGPGGP